MGLVLEAAIAPKTYTINAVGGTQLISVNCVRGPEVCGSGEDLSRLREELTLGRGVILRHKSPKINCGYQPIRAL